MQHLPRGTLILRKSVSGSNLTLNWNNIFNTQEIDQNADYAYELYWTGGRSTEMEKLADTVDTSYVLRTYDASQNYTFKVRVRFPCGCGPYSEDLVVSGWN